jgi:hypothetical protein
MGASTATYGILGVKLVGPLDGMRAGDLGRAHVVFILGT